MASPVVTRLMLEVIPTADPGYQILVPVQINETDQLSSGPRGRDVATILAALKTLRSDRTPVTYQEGSASYTVILEDFAFIPSGRTSTGSAWVGTCLLTLKVL